MPLISICIPTYNRCEILARTLESIVSQPEFTESDDFEVFVSDNCSDDRTPEIVRSFTDRFPDRVRGNRNEKNVDVENLFLSLEGGRGKFLKLNNDTLIHRPGSLKALREAVREAKDGEILFFPNRISTLKPGISRFNDLDGFVRAVSYWTTWSCAFGIWRTDLDKSRQLFVEKRDSMLPHAYVLLDLVAGGRGARVDSRELFESVIPGTKGGYNIAEVFGSKYTGFLQEFNRRGVLSNCTLELEKFRLFKFICSWYFDRSPQYRYDRTGFWKHLLPVYRRNLYIWPIAAFYWFAKGLLALIKR